MRFFEVFGDFLENAWLDSAENSYIDSMDYFYLSREFSDPYFFLDFRVRAERVYEGSEFITANFWILHLVKGYFGLI